MLHSVHVSSIFNSKDEAIKIAESLGLSRVQPIVSDVAYIFFSPQANKMCFENLKFVINKGETFFKIEGDCKNGSE